MRLSTVCPVPAGGIMVRDVRAWHGGTPNLSDATRSIPNLEFYAPWFREPILIAAHGNSLRALLLVMKVYKIEEINSVELSTGVPIHIIYQDSQFLIKK